MRLISLKITPIDNQAQRNAMQPTPNQIKHRLHQQGYTLKSWAAAQGFKYRTVSDVVRGLRQGHYGEGREVRQRLGLPVAD